MKGHQRKERAHLEKKREGEAPQARAITERRARRRRRELSVEIKQKKIPTVVLSKKPEDS